MLKPKKGEIRKPTKTISGITPVAVMLPPRKCEHGMCLYCPNMNVPQSYTPRSPVVMRAMKVGYDAFKQVQGRLKAFKAMNHPTDKVELIIMGGTFLEYPEDFQNEFIKGCYDALNNKISKNLEKAKKLNEKSKQRCVALCIETRPDRCIQFIDRIREFGATRVELGVQIIDNKIYEIVKRGHRVKDVINATKALRDAGFKIGYHIMPGLPMLKAIPRYCRVMRVMREIPPEYIVAGTKRIDLRAEIEKELRRKKSKIKEIRFREIGFALRDKKEINLDLKLKTTKYKAGKGTEYFLEIVNKDDILFGLLRLRVCPKETLSCSPPLKFINKKTRAKRGDNNQAIIRELHVYGKSLKIGQKLKIASQHQGLGKWLMNEAEKITMNNKIKKLSVISGVGVREYYRRLGYKLKDTYMVREIKK